MSSSQSDATPREQSFGRRLVRIFLWIIAIDVLVVALGYFGYLALLFLSIWVNTESEDGLRKRLAQDDALSELRTWALARLDDPEFRGCSGDAVGLPEGLRGLKISDVCVEHDTDVTGRKTRYLLIEFGGGFRHYGLYIGPTGFTRHRKVWPTVKQWDDEVWYYDEIPP